MIPPKGSIPRKSRGKTSGGLDLGKLIEIAKKYGGMTQGGLRGHVLGIPLGGKDLPLDRRVQETRDTKFEVKGVRPSEKAATPREPDIQELEIDPIEEDEKTFTIRGYMAGVEERDITCEVKENGKTLKISAQGRRKYEKEIELPASVIEKVDLNYRNGVLEIKLIKKKENK